MTSMGRIVTIQVFNEKSLSTCLTTVGNMINDESVEEVEYNSSNKIIRVIL